MSNRVEKWRHVAAIMVEGNRDRGMGYPGLTELTVGGRTFASLGQGPAVEQSLRAMAEQSA